MRRILFSVLLLAVFAAASQAQVIYTLTTPSAVQEGGQFNLEIKANDITPQNAPNLMYPHFINFQIQSSGCISGPVPPSIQFYNPGTQTVVWQLSAAAEPGSFCQSYLTATLSSATPYGYDEQRLPFKVMISPSPSATPASVISSGGGGAPRPSPGFEAVFAFAGLLVAAWAVSRRRK